MTISVVSTIAGAASSGSTTTTAIDTTGKTAARLWVYHETTGVPVITDSASGNVWVEDSTEGVLQVGNTSLGSVYNTYLRCFKNSGTFNTSASHTFTATLANGYCTVIPAAFAAEAGILKISDWSRLSDTTSPYAAPQISPVQDALLVAVGVDDVLATGAFDWSGSGFTKIQAQEGSSSWRGSLATRTITAGSYTPSFTDAASGINNTGIGVIALTEAFAFDFFTGTAGTTLQTHDSKWVFKDWNFGATNTVLDGSGHAYSTTEGSVYYYNETPSSANYSAFLTLTTGSTNKSGPAVRMSSSTITGIVSSWNNSAGLWYLDSVYNDTWTNIGTSDQLSPISTARVLELRVYENTAALFVDNTLLIQGSVGSVTDTGFAGFYGLSASSANWVDNFRADFIGPVGPPTITIQPQCQTSQIGATATFSLTVIGVDSYQWQSAPITSLYSKVPGVWSDITGEITSSYITPVLNSTDEGKWYRCICTNSNGTTISEAVRVFLRDVSITGIGQLLSSSWAMKYSHEISNGGMWLRDWISPEFSNGDVRELIFGDWWWPVVTTEVTVQVRIGSSFVACPVRYYNGSSFVNILDLLVRQSGAWV